MRAIALARSRVSVSSAATTTATALGADSIGRPVGTRAPNPPDPGLRARAGVVGRHHRAAEGEPAHDPPAPGARGGGGGDARPAAHAGQQEPAAAVAVG